MNIYVARIGGYVILCICTHAAFAQGSQTTSNEFWPELDTYFTINKDVQWEVSAKRERDVAFDNAQIGTNVTFSIPWFRPILFPRYVKIDPNRGRRITARLGFQYKRSLGTNGPINEYRPTIDLIFRWAFPKGILLADRDRFEFRFVNGVYSWRYRNEIKTERDFRLDGLSFTLFISAEPFYSSQKGWYRFRYSGGLVFPIGKHLSVGPYYTRQHSDDSAPYYINAVGLVLSVYLLQ